MLPFLTFPLPVLVKDYVNVLKKPHYLGEMVIPDMV